MTMRALRSRLVREESGFTLVELLVVVAIMGFILDGIANVFVSGQRAQLVMASQIDSQSSAMTALSRLEYEGRCASSATLVGTGQGVVFTLPSQCSHASGTVTWCVVSGELERFTASGCTGTGQAFVPYITSANPFSLQTSSGDLPRLAINLVTNETGAGNDQYAVNDLITLRNASASP